MLEYRRDRADMIQVYKILHDIDNDDKNKLFTMSTYTATRGHSLKLFKKRSRLNIRANTFSNRVVENWNSLSEDKVHAPSLNSFKTLLNRFWHEHPCKFRPSCYAPGPTARETRTYNQNASIEANSMVAYNWHLNIEILSRLFLLLCWLKMYGLILYRLPLTMVIATASRNTVQKCHPQRQRHETLLQLYVDIIVIISTSGHIM